MKESYSYFPKTMTIKIETDKGKTHTFKADEDAKYTKIIRNLL